MKKDLKNMSSQEVKKDFEALKDKNEVGLLLEYILCVKALGKINTETFFDIADYYSKLKNRFGSVTNSVYTITNENLDILFDQLNIQGKSVATVGSSGDQALKAIYYGAKEVVLIDGNLMTKVFTELKIAAIKNLTYQEYIDWIENVAIMKGPQGLKYYEKLYRDLSPDMRLFWDSILFNDSVINSFDFMNLFYFPQEDFLKFLKHSFVQHKKFLLLKSKLKRKRYELKYIFAELEDFPQKLKGKYDYILLSNIADYADGEKFYNVARELYKNNLKEGGSLQLGTKGLPSHLFKLIDDENALPMLVENAGVRGSDCLFMQKPKETENVVAQDCIEKVKI